MLGIDSASDAEKRECSFALHLPRGFLVVAIAPERDVFVAQRVQVRVSLNLSISRKPYIVKKQSRIHQGLI
jgi:hypothetical protein